MWIPQVLFIYFSYSLSYKKFSSTQQIGISGNGEDGGLIVITIQLLVQLFLFLS